MRIVTTFKRLGEDTQGDHIEVRTVYTGNREEIDALEEKMRVSIGDIQIVDVPDEIMSGGEREDAIL